MNLTRIVSEELTAEISPNGAELHSLKSGDGTEYLWQAGAAWNRHAPVLFPIVGKLKNDTYFYKDKNYRMTQHGFARDRIFELTETSASACTFELRADEKSLDIYPFRFRLKISYSLERNTLTCRYHVLNEGKDQMPFSIGAHPGFLCSGGVGKNMDDFTVRFRQHTFLQTSLQEGLRTNDTKVLPLEGKDLALSSAIFDNDALVFENRQVNAVSLVSKTTGRGVTMECEGWPYFGIWSKKGSNEFVCLEPWYGVADHIESTQDITKKDGIINLGPGENFSSQFRVSIT